MKAEVIYELKSGARLGDIVNKCDFCGDLVIPKKYKKNTEDITITGREFPGKTFSCLKSECRNKHIKIEEQ